MEKHHLEVRRTARYFTLGSPGATHAWVGCHGYGQLAEPFLGYLKPASTPERLLVAPEALSRFYHDNGTGPIGACWMTREDREHEIQDYLGYLDRVREAVAAAHSTPLRFYGLGFSQGVATVSRWMVQGTGQLEGAILWAGSVAPELTRDTLRARMGGRRVALVAGDRDQYLTPDWASRESARFTEAGALCHSFQFHGGHRLDRTVLAEAMAFVEAG